MSSIPRESRNFLPSTHLHDRKKAKVTEKQKHHGTDRLEPRRGNRELNCKHDPSTLPQSLPRTAKGAPSYVASEWTDKSLDLYFHAVLHGLDNDVLCCLSLACKYVHICRPSRQILTLLYESRRRPCRHSLKSKSWCNTQAIKIIVWFGGGNRNRTSRTHVLALGCQVLVHLAKIHICGIKGVGIGSRRLGILDDRLGNIIGLDDLMHVL